MWRLTSRGDAKSIAGMTDLTARGSAIDDLPDMWDGFMRMVRPGLGLSAFGANIMNLPPDYTTGAHDESDTGQQELPQARPAARR